MTYSINTRFLVGDLETIPGTMTTPTASDFNVRIRNPEVTPIIEWDDDAAKFANGNHAEDESVAGAQSATIAFQIRLGRDETITAAPNYIKFFSCCGIKTNAYSTNGIGLRPEKEYDNKTMTIWVYDMVTGGASPGAMCYKFAGCAGNVVFGSDGIGKPLIASFTFTGKCVDIIDVAYADIPVGGDFDTSHPEKLLNTAVLVGGVTGCISSWQLDAGNEITPVICQSDITGYSYYQITNRKPRLSLNPLMKATSVDDPWGSMVAGLTGVDPLQVKAIQIQYGGTTTHNLELFVPRAQQVQANIANREGIVNWDANYRCLANGWTGNLGFTGFGGEVTWELLQGARYA